MTRRWLYVLIFVGCICVVALTAQRLYIGPADQDNPRWASSTDFDGSILFCRGYYTSDRIEANGAGWFTDYPGADNNFLVRLSELTKVRVRFDQDRTPMYVVMPLTDPLLYKCPVLFMEDVGTLRFSEAAVRNLRSYFDKGGFLWVDDFWGSQAWDQWEEEIRRVLPSGLYPLIDIPSDHPILHQLYDLKGGIWQMSTYSIWMGGSCADGVSGAPCGFGTTSERGLDSQEPHLRGILDDHQRVIVIMTHNTDIADGWEEEKPENQPYINEFSARSYALGTNIFLYALTH